MEVVVPSWKQYLLQRERMTKNEREVIDKLRGMRIDLNPPEEWVHLSVFRPIRQKTVASAQRSRQRQMKRKAVLMPVRWAV